MIDSAYVDSAVTISGDSASITKYADDEDFSLSLALQDTSATVMSYPVSGDSVGIISSSGYFTLTGTPGTAVVEQRIYSSVYADYAFYWTITVNPAAPILKPATEITQWGFTINWYSVTGATSYEVDVSTVPSFSSYLSGYHALNVGNVTSCRVMQTIPYLKYYYRVRALN